MTSRKSRRSMKRLAGHCSRGRAAAATGPLHTRNGTGSADFPDTDGWRGMERCHFRSYAGYYIINTQDSASFRTIKRQDSDPQGPPESPRLFGRGRGGPVLSATVNGLPCWQPPWGRLTAVNVNTGEIAWQVPFGTPKASTRNADRWYQFRRWAYFYSWRTHFHRSRSRRLLSGLRFEDGPGTVEHKARRGGTSVPITYQGNDGRQYVAVTTGTDLKVFRLGIGWPKGCYGKSSDRDLNWRGRCSRPQFSHQEVVYRATENQSEVVGIRRGWEG